MWYLLVTEWGTRVFHILHEFLEWVTFGTNVAFFALLQRDLKSKSRHFATNCVYYI